MKSLTAFLLLLSFSLSLGLAQQPVSPQPPQMPQTSNPADSNHDVVRITTNLVQVDVVVTKDNKQVTYLSADDFEIFEDGRPQAITSFAYVSNASSNKSAGGTNKVINNPGVTTEPKVTQRTAVA